MSRSASCTLIFLIFVIVSGPVMANKPDTDEWGPIEFSASYIGDCGTFEIGIQETVSAFGHIRFDKYDEAVRGEWHFRGEVILFNSVDPSIYLTGKKTENNNVTIVDGDPISHTTGMWYRVNAPGYGSLLYIGGRAVWNQVTYEVYFQAGPSKKFDGDFSRICEALSQP